MSGDRLAPVEADIANRRRPNPFDVCMPTEVAAALVEIAKAARVAMASVDDTDFEDAVIALRLALARLDSGATEGDVSVKAVPPVSGAAEEEPNHQVWCASLSWFGEERGQCDCGNTEETLEPADFAEGGAAEEDA